jgi:hypothetical protein
MAENTYTQAESEDTDVNRLDGPKKESASKVSVEDVTAKAQLPVGDHVSVGGVADEVGEVEVVTQDAQVAPGIAASQGGEPVQEVYVLTDKVVTDPLGPYGVQIPSAAVNDVSLPIHALAGGTPEEQIERGDNEVETTIVSGE